MDGITCDTILCLAEVPKVTPEGWDSYMGGGESATGATYYVKDKSVFIKHLVGPQYERKIEGGSVSLLLKQKNEEGKCELSFLAVVERESDIQIQETADLPGFDIKALRDRVMPLGWRDIPIKEVVAIAKAEKPAEDKEEAKSGAVGHGPAKRETAKARHAARRM